MASCAYKGEVFVYACTERARGILRHRRFEFGLNKYTDPRHRHRHRHTDRHNQKQHLYAGRAFKKSFFFETKPVRGKSLQNVSARFRVRGFGVLCRLVHAERVFLDLLTFLAAFAECAASLATCAPVCLVSSS